MSHMNSRKSPPSGAWIKQRIETLEKDRIEFRTRKGLAESVPTTYDDDIDYFRRKLHAAIGVK